MGQGQLDVQVNVPESGSGAADWILCFMTDGFNNRISLQGGPRQGSPSGSGVGPFKPCLLRSRSPEPRPLGPRCFW